MWKISREGMALSGISNMMVKNYEGLHTAMTMDQERKDHN